MYCRLAGNLCSLSTWPVVDEVHQCSFIYHTFIRDLWWLIDADARSDTVNSLGRVLDGVVWAGSQQEVEKWECTLRVEAHC